jgi:Fe-S-cluster containining protein
LVDPAPFLNVPDTILNSHLEKLADLFSRMEKAYETVAAAYGFECAGCEDNCCLTLFYHHTLLEYLYLYRGYAQLPAAERARLQHAAAQVNQALEQADKKRKAVRSMCPLNREGRCTLYRYRPMICRLHGIPNEMRRSGHAPARGAGCGDFDRQCGDRPYIPFDRTPLYAEMARAEQTLREAVGFREKIRLTVAQMIAGFPP